MKEGEWKRGEEREEARENSEWREVTGKGVRRRTLQVA